MKVVEILFTFAIALMLCAFLILPFLSGKFHTHKKNKKYTFLFSISCLFIAVGAMGFLGSMLSAVGGLNWLPDSFEWPAGYVDGVVYTNNGIYIVPLTPSGRVQLYDAEWKFIRGWHVDAGGGTFK